MEVQIDEAGKWLSNLKLAKKEDDRWIKRSKKIVKRYRDDRQGWSDNNKRYNILWSNIQTIFPALYGRTPRADVQRRFKDQDPVGRTAAQILERALQYEIDHYGDFDASCKLAITDRLLPGRGVCWVRFEEKPTETTEGKGQPYECTPVDYVYWEDFRNSPARTWDEVTWIAKRIYMTKAEGVERFGEEFNEVPLTHEPVGLDEMKKDAGGELDTAGLKKAQVWEICDKTEKRVIWVAEGYSKTLDEKPDPYGLDGFWPIPRPLFATQTTDTLVPVPDYSLYQDQADEMDKLTNRIAMLVEACKVVGVYDASQTGVQRMLSEGVDNTLIPVDTWAALAEKGGIKGVIDFLPLEMVVKALSECYVAREAAKQVIYEITGLSDIIRGASIASETATAQQIKSQYASLRLKKQQNEVALFASEILRIKAQLMCDLYSPETLIQMSGIMGTEDAQYAEPAIQLLKSEPSRGFRIEVASDSLVEMDEQMEKESRMEFLTAAGSFLERALPVAQMQPELTPLLAEMLQYTVRSFKGGRAMEAAFDTAMAQITEASKQPKEPPPDPEQIKMQGQMQIEQMRMGMEQQKAQMQEGIEAQKMQHALEIESIKQQAETERFTYKANLEAQTKLQIAEIQANAKPTANIQVEGKDELTASSDRMSEVGEQVAGQMNEMMQSMTGAMQMLAEAMSHMNKPKRRTVETDAKGRIVGVVEEVNG